MIQLNEVKEFLRILHDEDDSKIQVLINSSIESLYQRLNCEVPTPCPYQIKQWLLFKVMELYDERKLGVEYDFLIQSYRVIPI